MAAFKEADVTVFFIEHDIEIIERYVNRVFAFYEGRVSGGVTADIAITQPLSP